MRVCAEEMRKNISEEFSDRLCREGKGSGFRERGEPKQHPVWVSDSTLACLRHEEAGSRFPHTDVVKADISKRAGFLINETWMQAKGHTLQQTLTTSGYQRKRKKERNIRKSGTELD